jgi:type IV secretory pathway VirB3-like protein
MLVSMMSIRKMGMIMSYWFMLMRVAMWFVGIPSELMCMLVMFIMAMFMVMNYRLMKVGMVMLFGYVQPNSNYDQTQCHPK